MCSTLLPRSQCFGCPCAAAGWSSETAINAATAKNTIPFILQAPPNNVRDGSARESRRAGNLATECYRLRSRILQDRDGRFRSQTCRKRVGSVTDMMQRLLHAGAADREMM